MGQQAMINRSNDSPAPVCISSRTFFDQGQGLWGLAPQCLSMQNLAGMRLNEKENGKGKKKEKVFDKM